MLKRSALLLAGACLGLIAAVGPPDWIASLGGKVDRDATGKIVGVNLRGTFVNDVEMVDIARIAGLERLDLSHTRISDEGMLHLKSATSIRELNLYYAEQITDQGMSAIRNWKELRRLDLRGTRIANGTLEIVSHLPHLEALDISNTQVTDNGMDVLIDLTGLKELELGRNRAGEENLTFLGMMPSLTELDLSGARPVPPDMGGAKRRALPISTMPQSTIEALNELRNLRTLKLGFSGVSASDLKALRSGLASVEKLALQECPRVDDEAAAELTQWKSLKYLDLQGTKVTPYGVEMLRKAKPGVLILVTPSVGL